MTLENARLSASLDRVVSAELLDIPASQVTQDAIREIIADYIVLPKYRALGSDDAERLARSLESRHSVRLAIGGVVELPHEQWLPQAKAGINPYYWDRYRQLLASKGLGRQVLATLDEVSDRTLGLCGDPRAQDAWNRRGLVLGNVQSGKTANYLGLICKAADAGYRVIIVIAGIHNNLRNQTQSRIDEGFIGSEKIKTREKSGKVVGVGRIDNTRQPSHFTSSNRDFSGAAATQVGIRLQNLREPAVFVIKKNPTTLANLIDWLQNSLNGSQIDSPLLLIDDEADNASINLLKDAGSASKINSQIREVLRMFSKSSYVGYTATPFANIFIDPDSDDEMIGQDLFPRDFIVSLDSPSNYVGANRVFLEQPEQFLRDVDDHEVCLPLSHKIDHPVTDVPDSLLNAVRAFLISRAIRTLRGQGEQHHSMLVNASRFTRVQSQLRNHVHAYVEDLRNALRLYGALEATDAEHSSDLISTLRNTWEIEYPDSNDAWREILPLLHDAAASATVVEVNSRSSGALNYAEHETGLNVIAVGGFSLSRGLTLEGLTITYFLRNSVMYDTLLQMGRWFGYRPGYEDLCRVWMTQEAQDWYAHITESIEMLRNDIKAMEASGATPQDFGLRVRSHPDSLIVTARNKMRAGTSYTVKVGLGGTLIESTPVSVKYATENTELTRKLISSMRPYLDPEARVSGHLFRRVPAEAITGFIGGYVGDPASTRTQKDPVIEYIRARAESTLAEWDVLLVSRASKRPASSDPVTGDEEIIGDLDVVYPMRTAGRHINDSLYIGSKHRVASRGIEKAGLSTDQIRLAEEKYKGDNSESENTPDIAYRGFRRSPLLILQMLRMRSDERSALPTPIVSWGASFPYPPPGEVEKHVTYVVNTVWMREHFDDGDEEESDNDPSA